MRTARHTLCSKERLKDSTACTVMETNEVLERLEKSETEGSLQVFRDLISYASSFRKQPKNKTPTEEKQWQPISSKLLEIITDNEELGKERVLLACHAFLALLNKHHTVDYFKSNLKKYLELETNQLHFCDRNYAIRNVELFKLVVTHGYLQVNDSEIYRADICAVPFEILYSNCIRYTRYSYFAYRILQVWLQRTMKTDFWETCDDIFERKLETIIYSNWDNSIKEISKQNAISVFNKYLRIMRDKYDGFLAFAFSNCVRDVSWQNETKYVILAEICDVWEDVTAMTQRDFVLCLFTCLTRNYLRSAGTRIYNAIVSKLSEEQWKETFGPPIACIVSHWESGARQNHRALQLLCTHWLEPTVEKHRNILPYLWTLSGEGNSEFLFRSHLERMASKTGIIFPEVFTHIYLDHSEEIIRINSFAAHCQSVDSAFDDDSKDPCSEIKHFLFYNANANTTFLRGSMVTHFKVWFVNLMKLGNSREGCTDRIFDTLDWLHEFLLDCFEIGSCYQRKVLGLNLYRAVLFYTTRSNSNEKFLNDSRYREALKHGFKMGERLKTAKRWRFSNKRSLILLLKLVLDPANDVRDISADVILEHFAEDCLTEGEKKVLLDVAKTKCNSSKFYETESGAVLFKILSNWLPFAEIDEKARRSEQLSMDESQTIGYLSKTHTSYLEFFLYEAQNQLREVEQDVLRAATHNAPFYGVVTAILTVGFRKGPESGFVTEEFAGKLLDLLENAVQFFIQLLSSKSNDSEFSSSFAEMGLAIDEMIKHSDIDDDFDDVILSPAHQIVISCIWTSLKVSCELASEIGALLHSYETVQRSANLITSVLTKCRHKGAIEAAGMAIGRLTRSLCSEDKYSAMPESWLHDLLRSDQVACPNLTRRSAGLSIMFHRVVANDNRRDRPLVHTAVRMLLVSLEEFSGETTDDKESFRDSPQARNLFFLRALVADSELHAQMVSYLERITLVCFKNLPSQVWTIRNASLQLYGAIVPRLVGQCTGGKSLDFGNGHSVDHFVTHYPTLADHLLSQLEFTARLTSDNHQTLETHSRIVHILTLLSKISTGGSEFIDYSSGNYVAQVKCQLLVLFASPIGHVRVLSAKAYAALVAYPTIILELEKFRQIVHTVDNHNLAHGYLCTMKYLRAKLAMETDNANPEFRYEELEDCGEGHNFGVNRALKKKCQSGDNAEINMKQLSGRLIEDGQPNISENSVISTSLHSLCQAGREHRTCYILESILIELSGQLEELSVHLFLFNQVGRNEDLVLDSEHVKPGFAEFIETVMRLYADYVKRTHDINADTASKILSSQCTDLGIAFLNYLKCYTPLFGIVLDLTLNTFRTCNFALLDAMINFLLECTKQDSQYFSPSIISESELRTKAHCLIEKTKTTARHSGLEHLRHVLVSIYSSDDKTIDETVLYVLKKVIHEDEENRQLAAECLHFLVQRWSTIRNKTKLDILKSVLILLKDEIPEIRELVRVSFAALWSNDGCVQSIGEVIHHRILSEVMMNKSMFATFSKREIVSFFKDCADRVQCSKNSDAVATMESPFDHDDDASYAEGAKLLNILYYCLLRLESDSDDSSNTTPKDLPSNSDSRINFTDVILTKYELQQKANLDFDDLKAVLRLPYKDYLLAKKNKVLQSCCSE